MSNTPDLNVASVDSIEKPSLVKRGVAFVKTHKKATIAVSLVTGLVVANAIANRGDDDSPVIEGVYVPSEADIAV